MKSQSWRFLTLLWTGVVTTGPSVGCILGIAGGGTVPRPVKVIVLVLGKHADGLVLEAAVELSWWATDQNHALTYSMIKEPEVIHSLKDVDVLCIFMTFIGICVCGCLLSAGDSKVLIISYDLVTRNGWWRGFSLTDDVSDCVHYFPWGKVRFREKSLLRDRICRMATSVSGMVIRSYTMTAHKQHGRLHSINPHSVAVKEEQM